MLRIIKDFAKVASVFLAIALLAAVVAFPFVMTAKSYDERQQRCEAKGGVLTGREQICMRKDAIL